MFGSAPRNLLWQLTWEHALDPLDVDSPKPSIRKLRNRAVPKAGGEEDGWGEPIGDIWGPAFALSLPRMGSEVSVRLESDQDMGDLTCARSSLTRK